MHFTYVLKSLKDGRRYIGFTEDIARRIEFHNKGLNPSTKNRRPFILICYRTFQEKKDAIYYERYLKRLKGGAQLDIEMQQMLKDNQVPL